MSGKKRMRLPNGFGQISKISSQRLRNPWRAMVTTGWDGNGKPIRFIVGYYSTYNEAYMALLEYHKAPQSYEISVEELYKRWSDEHYKKVSDSRPYESAWRCYASPISDMKVSDVKSRHILELLSSNIPKTQKRRLKIILTQMFDYAIVYNMTEVNPCDRIKIERESQSHHVPFSDDELDLLWRSIDTNKVVVVILIACYSGWRPSEILSCTIDRNLWIMTGGMKTKAGRGRVVPVHPKIRPLILGAGSLLEGKMSYETYANNFKDTMKKLGLSHTPHDTRTTFITMAKKKGLDEYAIKRLVGHSISDITEEVYTKRDMDWLRSEIEKL